MWKQREAQVLCGRTSWATCSSWQSRRTRTFSSPGRTVKARRVRTARAANTNASVRRSARAANTKASVRRSAGDTGQSDHAGHQGDRGCCQSSSPAPVRLGPSPVEPQMKGVTVSSAVCLRVLSEPQLLGWEQAWRMGGDMQCQTASLYFFVLSICSTLLQTQGEDFMSSRLWQLVPLLTGPVCRTAECPEGFPP